MHPQQISGIEALNLFKPQVNRGKCFIYLPIVLEADDRRVERGLRVGAARKNDLSVGSGNRFLGRRDKLCGESRIVNAVWRDLAISVSDGRGILTENE